MYPFAPKSTAKLERGQYWPIPLANGTFGAGCVVGKYRVDNGKYHSRLFIAGVLQWNGSCEPTDEELAGFEVYQTAFAHIKCITALGVPILGRAQIRFTSEPELAESGDLSTWGYAVPTRLAEKYAALAANHSLQARRP